MKIILTLKPKRFIPILIAVLVFGYGAKSVVAQDSPNVLYVPLIGITSVPDPLALPGGPGNVTYHYAVKNFIEELPLSNIQVIDDKCGSVKFVEGDDNSNSKLDYSETWRYTCTTKLSTTIQSTATATGVANNITATHTAYVTVVVGSNTPPPLVSIVNVTKVAYPLSLPPQGGDITFTYRVSNPGIVPLGGVTATDDKCSVMSGRLGDTNGNNLLDVNEVWIYTCTATLKQTTTNTVHVTAFANGLKAVGEATITVKVETPALPEVGSNPDVGSNLKITVWAILSGVLVVLVIFFLLTRERNVRKIKGKE